MMTPQTLPTHLFLEGIPHPFIFGMVTPVPTKSAAARAITTKNTVNRTFSENNS